MRLVSESKVTKMLIKQGINFDQAHILAMEVVNMFLDDKNDHLELEAVISQLIEREQSKVA